MIADWERRQADRFYADLMGLRRADPRPNWVTAEQASPDPSEYLRKGRLVFYDEDTLQYIEGWTRASQTGYDDVFLVNRARFDPIRNGGRERGRRYDDYLRRMMHGERDLMEPLFVIDATLHTAPFSPRTPGDWDDLMISRLIAASRKLTIQSEHDQWAEYKRMKDNAVAAAQNAGRGNPPQEFVDFFLLDNAQATLRLFPASGVTMEGSHARIALSHSTTSRGVRVALRPGATDTGERVIGDIHTHALLDPLINTTSTATGTRIGGAHMVSGVSEVDVDSARTERFVVYAIDSQYLHRANPDGSKNDKLPQSGDVLREALRLFGREPTVPVR